MRLLRALFTQALELVFTMLLGCTHRTLSALSCPSFGPCRSLVVTFIGALQRTTSDIFETFIGRSSSGRLCIVASASSPLERRQWITVCHGDDVEAVGLNWHRCCLGRLTFWNVFADSRMTDLSRRPFGLRSEIFRILDAGSSRRSISV